ncbi:MAG: hypothetical protein ACLTOX_01825 [Streptococcus thermophilus]
MSFLPLWCFETGVLELFLIFGVSDADVSEITSLVDASRAGA